jgi:transposase-like protein
VGKPWTQEEIDYLESKWGVVATTYIANKLGKSVNAIKLKANRLGYEDNLHSGEEITLNQLFIAIGLTNSMTWYIKKFKDYGFPWRYKKVIQKKFRVISIEKFWAWAENNKQLLNFARFEKGSLGKEPEWVDIKRKADQMHPSKNNWNRPWSKKDELLLIELTKSNRYTYKDLAATFKRTEASIKRRLMDLGTPYRPVPRDNHIKWTDEEKKKMIELYNQGYSCASIAKTMDKTELSISDRLKAALKG